jgi:DNA-binding response OmpR family regulator
MTRRPEDSQILIVEHDEAMAGSYAQMLRLQGYQVRIAFSAEQGLLEADLGPDVILVDFHMPDFDALAFLRRLRASNHRIPVAIVTGDYFLDDAISTELAALGAVVRFKPLWLEELVILVGNLLAGELDGR